MLVAFCACILQRHATQKLCPLSRMAWYGMVEVCEGAPVAVSGWVLTDRHDVRPCAMVCHHNAMKLILSAFLLEVGKKRKRFPKFENVVRPIFEICSARYGVFMGSDYVLEARIGPDYVSPVCLLKPTFPD